MWDRSNSPARLRTAWCSARSPLNRSGICQPAKSVIVAPAARCSAYKGVLSSVMTSSSSGPATSAADGPAPVVSRGVRFHRQHVAGRIKQDTLRVRAEDELAQRGPAAQPDHDQGCVGRLGGVHQGRGHIVTALQLLQLEVGIGLLQQLSETEDRKSTRLNSSHVSISYAVFC